MKAIILAAWEWTRLRPITNTVPKPLIKIAGKTILEYNLESIYDKVDEIIIVVKYLKEKIEDYFWDNYKGTKINYQEQWDEKWTWWAIKGINIKWDIIIFVWDQIFFKEDIDKIFKLKWYGWLVTEVDKPEIYWIFHENDKWYANRVVEKPTEYIWNLANISFYKVNSDILKFINEIELSPRWELEITDAINLFIKNYDFKLVKWDFIDVGYPEDIEKAEKVLNKKKYSKPEFWEYRILEDFWETFLSIWIPKSEIKTLFNFSQDNSDEQLVKNTWDLSRFSSIEKIEKWYNDKGRYLFCLLDKNHRLAWIWWWRPWIMPDCKDIINKEIYDEIIKNKNDIHTSWVRIYPEFRWKWLAKNLLIAEKHYRNIFPNCYMSIDIDKDNIPSQRASEKSGFKFFAIWKNDNSNSLVEKNRMIYVKMPK